jgi:hypothetical protein
MTKFAVANGTAVATAERFAAFVSFQRMQASRSRPQNANSAASPVSPAVQFSGNFAILATFTTF